MFDLSMALGSMDILTILFFLTRECRTHLCIFSFYLSFVVLRVQIFPPPWLNLFLSILLFLVLLWMGLFYFYFIWLRLVYKNTADFFLLLLKLLVDFLKCIVLKILLAYSWHTVLVEGVQWFRYTCIYSFSDSFLHIITEYWVPCAI